MRKTTSNTPQLNFQKLFAFITRHALMPAQHTSTHRRSNILHSTIVLSSEVRGDSLLAQERSSTDVLCVGFEKKVWPHSQCSFAVCHTFDGSAPLWLQARLDVRACGVRPLATDHVVRSLHIADTQTIGGFHLFAAVHATSCNQPIAAPCFSTSTLCM
jgi:hypothetical protein